MPVLIDLITGETINQSFTATQQQCSYVVLLQDTTTISPSTYDRGKIDYFIKYPDNTRKKIGTVNKGQSFYYDFCSPGIFTIVQLLTIREIPNCGGVSPIIYQSEIEQNVTVLEHYPYLNLPAIESCLIKGSNSQLVFTFQLNNNVCGTLPNIFKIQAIESPYGSNLQNVELSNPTTPYNWTPTLNKAGVYKVKVSIQNCCHLVEEIFEFYVCEPVQIRKDCCDCTKFYVSNHSNLNINYKLIQIYPENNDFVEINSTLEANKETLIEVTSDGVFNLIYTDIDNQEKYRFWHVFCKIDQCLNNILKNVLCKNCSECPSESEIKEREKLNKIMLLTQLYYKWIDEEMKGKLYINSVENPFIDYENRIKELFTVQDVYEKIIEICSNCSSYNTKDCKCGCN